MARPRKTTVKLHDPTDQGQVRLYTLEVFLLSGPISEKFAKKNRVSSRTIQIRGDQTLEDLHRAIFDAFGRWEEHMYEFQFGKGPMDPKGPRYVLPDAFEMDRGGKNPPAGRVDQTRIDSLGLEVGRSFGYWFDFGDDWWHQINVEAIEDEVPSGKFPKVTKRSARARRNMPRTTSRYALQAYPSKSLSQRGGVPLRRDVPSALAWASMKRMMSATVWISAAASSGMLMSNSSSNSMINST